MACLERNGALADNPLEILVKQLKRLPSDGGVYHKILEELRDPNGTLETVGVLVASDPAIAVEVIRTVNSAAFGYSRTICDPLDATLLLGGDQILAITLMVEVFGIQDGVHCPGFSFPRLMSHSRTVGWNARGLMRQERAKRQLVGAAFTGGLLHDVGKLLLAANFPNEYGGCGNQTEEERVFGANHAAIGARFLERWEVPGPIVEGVAQHGILSAGTGDDISLSDSLFIANAQAHFQQQTAPSGDSLSDQISLLEERFGGDRMAEWGFR